jgi:iron complex outermembrane receptor protein
VTLKNALLGYGGDNCDKDARAPGDNGCLFFNPFSNRIEVSASNGITNPNLKAELANSQKVLDYVSGVRTSQNDHFSLRDSVSTTFRGPKLN